MVGIKMVKIQTLMGIFSIYMVMCDHACHNKLCVNNTNLTSKQGAWMTLDIWHTHPTHISYPLNNHVGFYTNMWQLHVAWRNCPWPLFCVHNKGMQPWNGPSWQVWLGELPWASLWIVHKSCSNLDNAPLGCSHVQCVNVNFMVSSMGSNANRMCI